jgi:hypothetical protein
MTVALVIVLVAVVIAAVLVIASRYRQSRDGVDSFRRQIDALSPEARRPVVDQVQSAAGANDDDETDEEVDDDDA